MRHIKSIDEFSLNNILFKPKIDFGCLTLTERDLKKWYNNVKDTLEQPVYDHEYDNFKNPAAIYERKGEILAFDDFAKEIIGKYKFVENQFIKQEYNNGIGLYIAIYKDDSIAEALDIDMRKNGFFISKSEVKGKSVKLFFEPMEQAKINDVVFSRNFIYHYTPFDRVDNILKNGLVPMGGNNPVNPVYKFPPRVYFTLFENNGLANSLRNTLIENGIITDPHYILLKIDLRDLKNDIDFYFDAYCTNCVFTPNLILPMYISEFKEGYLLGGDKFKVIHKW